MIKRHPFFTFCTIIAVLVAAALIFIQSARFAHIVKKIVAEHLPSDLGIQGDFSEFSIGLFPPSVSIRNPKVSLGKKNLINLPAGSEVTAQRIDLRFQIFQMLSGQIKVHEVAIVDGDVKLILHAAKDSPNKKKSVFKPDVNWEELLQVRAEAISIENTKIHLEAADSKFAADFTAERLKLAQWRGHDGLGYELRADFKDINSTILKDYLPSDGISKVSAVAHINANGALIDDIFIVSEGLELRASGQLKGNILADRSLGVDSKLNFTGDLNTISQFFKLAQPLDLAGKVQFSGRFRCNLEDPVQTARAEGKLKGEDVQFQKWFADQVSAEADYIGSPKGGELAVRQAEIDSKEIPRSGSRQPGQGGKIEIGAFHFGFGTQAQQFSVPIRLERVHLHWLAPNVLKYVYGLDFRATGPVDAAFVPREKGWDIQAKVNLDVDGFQLDNQKYGEEKPLHRVFKVAKLNVNGPLSLSASGLKINSVVLSMPQSRLVVNGSVSPRSGYDLLGEGPVNLADLGEIADNTIKGIGKVSVHTHGPSSRVIVDIDTDLKDVFYVNLKFGDMKGRVTWDDDPDRLIFSQVQVQKNETQYFVLGQLDFHGENLIDVNVNFPSGNIHDVSSVFDNLTSDLWWYPRGLSGAMKGSVKVSGGLALNKLSAMSDIQGFNWLLLGEKFRTVSLHGGYNRGTYLISDLKATKQNGRINGRISYDAEKRFDWNLKTQGLQINDFDHIAKLDVPVRGKIGFESSGKGLESNLESTTLTELTDASVRGVAYPSSRLSIRTDSGIATVKGVALDGEGVLDFTYSMNPGGSCDLRAEGKHLDFAPLLLLINPSLMQDSLLQGFLTANLRIGFKSGEIEKSNGSLAVEEYHLSKTGSSFQLFHPVTSKIVNGEFSIQDLGVTGNSDTAILNLKGKPSQLDGTISGAVDLSVLEFFTAAIGKASGSATLDFNIEGLLKAPILFGQADVENGTLRLPSIDSPIENISGNLMLRDGTVNVQNLEADLGGGRLYATGTVELFTNKYPTLNLKGQLAGNRLRIFPFQFIRLKGAVNVAGGERPYLVSGAVSVDSAMVREKILNQKQTSSSKSLPYSPSSTGKPGTADTDVPLFRLKIDVNADRGIMVDNDLFQNAEFKTHVVLVNTIDSPALLGTADFVQGKMVFKDRIFQIQSAGAKFETPTQIDPSFNLTATADVGSTKVQLYATGTKENLKLEFTSTPSLSESEILSLLAIGGSGTQSFQYNSIDRSQLQQGEAASLLLQSMDFNRDFQDKTGFEIQLDESINPLQGLSIFNAKAPTEETAEPKIVLKRRVGERLTLSYGSTVGVGTDKESDFNAEYSLTPGLSAIGVYENYESQDINEKLDTQSSYGVDLKLQKRFK